MRDNTNGQTVIYDGRTVCHTNNCCPVVTYDQTQDRVAIAHPEHPELGNVSMTKQEYNDLLRHATPIA